MIIEYIDNDMVEMRVGGNLLLFSDADEIDVSDFHYYFTSLDAYFFIIKPKKSYWTIAVRYEF